MTFTDKHMSDAERLHAQAQAAFEGAGLKLPFGIVVRKIDNHTIAVDCNTTERPELFGSHKLHI
jgi:hypothetical protein